MASTVIYELKFEQAFTSATSVTCTHNMGSRPTVRVIVGGVTRPDLIDYVEVNSNNQLTVHLTASSTGRVQLVQPDTDEAPLYLSTEELDASFLQLKDQSVAVSPSNKGRLRYNSTLQRFEKSENAGSFVALSGSGGDPAVTMTEATTTTTTTSTTYAQVSSMTVTPAAGTYLVTASGAVSNNTNSATGQVSIFSAGTQVAASEREYLRGNQTITNAFHTMAKVTVNGSQAIDLRWKTSSGTMTMYERQLMIMKVS